jgi:hypothetical protein
MKVLIEMSVEVYDSLLDKCDQSCAEYYTLTKANIGFRLKEDHQLKLMRIFCEVNEATRLLAMASRICLDAVPYIEKAIATARDS